MTTGRPNGYVRWLAESWTVSIECAHGAASGTGKTRAAAMAAAKKRLTPEMGRIEFIWDQEPMGLERAQAHFDLLCYIGSGQWRRDHEEDQGR